MYKKLFFEAHTLITKAEMDSLDLKDLIHLINIKSKSFSIEEIQYVQARFEKDGCTDKSAKLVEEFLRSSFEVLDPETIAFTLIRFMDSTNQIIPDFEDVIIRLSDSTINQKSEDDDEAKSILEDLFEEYQKVINKVALNGLREQTLEYIYTQNKYKGYVKEVAEQLYIHEYYIDYILISISQGEDIKFEEDALRSSVEEHVDWLIDEHLNLFAQLRYYIVKTQTTNLLQFKFLFTAKCPIMTSEELEAIESNDKNSDNTVMDLVPPKLVTKETTDILIKYFCRKKQINSVAFEILKYISEFTVAVVESCFYDLDFDNIRYRTLAKEKKEQIKTLYIEILKLDTSDGKIKFMETTNFLDNSWEAELLNDLKENEKLRNRYFAIVNQNEKITKETIETLCAIGTISPMSQLVLDKFFEHKKYKKYVLSKALSEESFIIEPGERGNLLWSTYVAIFCSETEYDETKRYMADNKEFLQRVLNEKAYISLPPKRRMHLCSINQDAECLLDILNYDSGFALDYLLNIAGFQDEEAASAFMDIIKEMPALLDSKELYDYIYPKLPTSQLKAKFTRLRRKHHNK